MIIGRAEYDSRIVGNVPDMLVSLKSELTAGEVHALRSHEIDHDCDALGCPDWARRTFETAIDDTDVPDESE